MVKKSLSNPIGLPPRHESTQRQPLPKAKVFQIVDDSSQTISKGYSRKKIYSKVKSGLIQRMKLISSSISRGSQASSEIDVAFKTREVIKSMNDFDSHLQATLCDFKHSSKSSSDCSKNRIKPSMPSDFDLLTPKNNPSNTLSLSSREIERKKSLLSLEDKNKGVLAHNHN